MQCMINIDFCGCSSSCVVTDFVGIVREENSVKIWTDAFQVALDRYEIINIPAFHEPYYIDKSLVVPSNRHIEVQGGGGYPSEFFR